MVGMDRTVRVLGPDEDERVELQLGELGLHARGARERGVRVVRDAEAGEFAVVLALAEQAEAARWTEPVAATEIWERLDGAPVRRAELEARDRDAGG